MLGEGGQAVPVRRCPRPVPSQQFGFAGFRFPPDVILVAVRWYLRYGLSYRDVEELLAERGISVDHVTIYRWVQRFTPLLIDAARPCRHAPGDRKGHKPRAPGTSVLEVEGSRSPRAWQLLRRLCGIAMGFT